MLENTDTRLTAMAAQVIRHGDAEGGLVCRDGSGSRREDGPAYEGLADGFVRRGVDDRDVGDARVRGVDRELHVHGLAGGVLLDGAAVGVAELVAFADVEVAFGGVVVFLVGDDLHDALDVAVGVAGLVVVGLLAAGRLEVVLVGRGGNN